MKINLSLKNLCFQVLALRCCKLQVFISDKRRDERPSLSITGKQFLPKVEREASGI